MAERRIPQSQRGEEAVVESFTTPDTFYSVHLYTDSHGVVIGGSCDCAARVAPLRDKHILLQIAEEYGAKPPKSGRFVTPDFLKEVAVLTGISYCGLSDAFTGERREVARSVVSAAVAIDRDGGPESWGAFCRGWAKRHQRGQHHPAILNQPEIVWGFGDRTAA